MWKDQLTSWVPLKDLKASNPAVELAEYAVANHIASRGTSFQMVGIRYIAQAEPYHFKGKEEILENDS
jgi:hypothetical protein